MPKKYKQVKVNLDFDIHAELSLLADENGMSLAELFRQSVGTSLEKLRVPRGNKRVHKNVNPKLLFEVNSMGNNLNQIAKHLNQGDKLNINMLNVLIEIETNLKRLL